MHAEAASFLAVELVFIMSHAIAFLYRSDGLREAKEDAESKLRCKTLLSSTAVLV